MLQIFTRGSAAVVLAAVLLAGCAGKMSTQRVGSNQIDNPEQTIGGVVFYQPALFAETTVRTTLISDGKLVGRSSDSPPACSEVTVERVLLMPDLAKPYRINYEPGLFETNRFGVTLTNGMLAAVNAQPSSEVPKLPIPGVQTLASTVNPGFALVGGGQEAFVVPAQGRTNPTACNDGPVVIGYRRLVIP
jgi:hypothetical protein